MTPLLADPGLKASVRDWPLTVEGAPRVRNLLFYEDPDTGAVTLNDGPLLIPFALT